uniref:Uncharacterized protein n=1 Tax=Marmota marmota marmota TaxID=9994 RepID=A0A8C5ZS28_MARMA
MFSKGHSCKLASHLALWRLGHILNGCIHSRAGKQGNGTPELLAQGPVSLLTPEKHPRAL